jgi:hypothetical protein
MEITKLRRFTLGLLIDIGLGRPYALALGRGAKPTAHVLGMGWLRQSSGMHGGHLILHLTK